MHIATCSLTISYFQKREFMGEHATEPLVNVALKHVKAIQYDLTAHKFKRHIENQATPTPWLITFCGEDGGKGY